MPLGKDQEATVVGDQFEPPILRAKVPADPFKDSLVATTAAPLLSQQQVLQFADKVAALKLWEYAVLVTNTDYALTAIGQLYRDRADCENGFDELKNQCGWGGYTTHDTHDLERCSLSARAVALIYHGWSGYVRLAHPQARREAITSRPLLLSGVARLTEHAGQARLLLTLMHGAGAEIKAMLVNIRMGLAHVQATVLQLTALSRWTALVRYTIGKIIAVKPKNPAPLGLHPPWLAYEALWQQRNLGLSLLGASR